MIRKDIIDTIKDTDVVDVNGVSIKIKNILNAYNRTNDYSAAIQLIQFKSKCDRDEAKSIVEELVEMYTIEDDDDSDEPYKRPYQKGEIIRHQQDTVVSTTYQSSNTIVICPYCHSTSTKKITMSKKLFKGWLWGIAAASTLTKEWHCNNCGSDF